MDHCSNPFIPRSFLHLLPGPISWFLGHRSKPRLPIGSALVWFWAFIGAFAGILVVEAVFRTEALKSRGTPIVIASLGAAAVLEYHTIDSPLAQPRNVILGQLFSAIISVGITKLFRLNSNFENLRWIAGALAVGLSSAFMGFTHTIHPPAGATALLAVTTDEITELGWLLLPLILLGSLLMVAVACVVNNIQRTFPMYWWTPADLRHPKEDDLEGEVETRKAVYSENAGRSSYDEDIKGSETQILISDGHIHIPGWISLDSEEKAVLEILRSKVQKGLRERSIPTAIRSQTLISSPTLMSPESIVSQAPKSILQVS